MTRENFGSALLYGGLALAAFGLTRSGAVSGAHLVTVDRVVSPLAGPLVVTSRYGEDRAQGPHRGVDLRASVGTPIHAPEDGIARLLESDAGGNMLQIHASTGRVHLFAHLASSAVSDGEPVTAGQIVGWSGDTGRVSGPHLHWQVFRGKDALDPLSLVSRAWQVGRALGGRRGH